MLNEKKPTQQTQFTGPKASGFFKVDIVFRDPETGEVENFPLNKDIPLIDIEDTASADVLEYARANPDAIFELEGRVHLVTPASERKKVKFA